MPKRRLFAAILILLSLFGILFVFQKYGYANSLDDELNKISKKLEKKQKQLSDIRAEAMDIAKTITNLSSQLTITATQVSDVENNITDVEDQLKIIKNNLNDRNARLLEKVSLRNKLIRTYAKRSIPTDLEAFLNISPSSGVNGFQLVGYTYGLDKAVNNELLTIIAGLSSEIDSFEKDKAEAESLKNELNNQRKRLVDLKNQLESQKNSAKTQQGVLSAKQKSLESDIAELSAKQQQILVEKSGDGSSSVGEYEQPEAKLPEPGFSPAFVAMSYGAYTHGNGMSQYGAKGRAEDGKSYKDILNFYYKTGVKKDDSFPKKISVQGYGDMDFQRYLYGIAEMPSDWPEDALKAQAIAARTYANRAGKPICTTDSCQVFLKSKSDNPPSRWKKAADDTKNMILNDPSTSQYSSTTGGYINNVGWDVKGNWPNDSYEKKAGSPWFYKAWYTKSYSSNDRCGLSSPWLNEKEIADILNSVVVWDKGNGTDKDRISPITTGCWGGNPYSLDSMASRADELGEKYTNVSGVSVDVTNNGKTSKVTFQTNKGSVTIDGAKFKTVFNLRASGYISIRNNLYDIVKK